MVAVLTMIDRNDEDHIENHLYSKWQDAIKYVADWIYERYEDDEDICHELVKEMTMCLKEDGIWIEPENDYTFFLNECKVY